MGTRAVARDEGARYREVWPLNGCAMRARQTLLIIILCLATSAAAGETVEISGDWGGLLALYQAKWKALAAKEHVNVRISGPCVSACTALAYYIPRQNICVTPTGSLGFHLAFPPFITQDFPTDIQAWITQKGGLSYHYLWLKAPEIYQFFRQCPFDRNDILRSQRP
jgi:hypothetical protein